MSFYFLIQSRHESVYLVSLPCLVFAHSKFGRSEVCIKKFYNLKTGVHRAMAILIAVWLPLSVQVATCHLLDNLRKQFGPRSGPTFCRS